MKSVMLAVAMLLFSCTPTIDVVGSSADLFHEQNSFPHRVTIEYCGGGPGGPGGWPR